METLTRLILRGRKGQINELITMKKKQRRFASAEMSGLDSQVHNKAVNEE